MHRYASGWHSALDWSYISATNRSNSLTEKPRLGDPFTPVARICRTENSRKNAPSLALPETSIN